MPRIKLFMLISVVGLAMVVGGVAIAQTSSSSGGASASPTGPSLGVSVTRIASPMKLESGETLQPVASPYTPAVSAAEAFKAVPAFLGQPQSAYLGQVADSRFLDTSSSVDVYVFRFTNTCLPSNAYGWNLNSICANGATIDVQVDAGSGSFIALSQVTS